MAVSTFYAVSGHAPDEVIKFLLKYDSEPTYYTLGIGERLQPNKRIRQKYILVLRQEDFIFNYKILVSLGKKIFVFGSPLFFLNYIGFNYLDFEIDETDCSKIYIQDYLNSNLFLAANPSEVKKHDVTYFECVVEKAKAGSIFDKLMTFIYKLPAKTHQKPVKKLCCLCIRDAWSSKVLDNRMHALLSNIKISQEIVISITEILNSETAERYKKAFALIKTEADVNRVAKEADLNPYEFMYILKMLEKDRNIDKGEASIDSYLANDKVKHVRTKTR